MTVARNRSCRTVSVVDVNLPREVEMKHANKGYSLMELMIVVTVVAILLALSYPSYLSYIRKSNRAEALVTLLDWANQQEIWRADNPSYNSDIKPADSEKYAYTLESNASSFTLTATAQGAQASDVANGVSCEVITLNQSGIGGPSGHEACWNH